MRWMDLESVIQSEVKSEREKRILYTNAHIWNLKKIGTDEPSGRAGIKTQTYRTDGLEDTVGKGKLGSERVAPTYTHYQM